MPNPGDIFGHDGWYVGSKSMSDREFLAPLLGPCTDVRSLFYSQARAAAELARRERSSMSSNEINTERLATLMAAFENGDVGRADNPFDTDDPIALGQSQAGLMAAAFAALAVSDTPRLEGTSEIEHNTALVVAGLWQGMWIGYEYAHRTAYGDES